MAAPTPTHDGSLMAVLIAAAGPVAGQYGLIVMAALAGALWPLSSMHGLTRTTGALLLLRIVATATFLSGSAAWLIERWTGVPAYDALSVAAFGIGALGNGWQRVTSALRDGLAALARGLGGRQS